MGADYPKCRLRLATPRADESNAEEAVGAASVRAKEPMQGVEVTRLTYLAALDVDVIVCLLLGYLPTTPSAGRFAPLVRKEKRCPTFVDIHYTRCVPAAQIKNKARPIKVLSQPTPWQPVPAHVII